jgi:hypothetical protein
MIFIIKENLKNKIIIQHPIAKPKKVLHYLEICSYNLHLVFYDGLNPWVGDISKM